jgi:hypothetical protein
VVGKQETGDRRQETGDRRQETEDRRQKTEDRRQKTEANPLQQRGMGICSCIVACRNEKKSCHKVTKTLRRQKILK